MPWNLGYMECVYCAKNANVVETKNTYNRYNTYIVQSIDEYNTHPAAIEYR